MLKILLWFCATNLMLSTVRLQSYESFDGMLSDHIISKIAHMNPQKFQLARHKERKIRQAELDPKNETYSRKFDVSKCCNIELTEEQQKAHHLIGDLREQCAHEIYGDEIKYMHRAGFICIMECVGKRLNFIDAKNNLNEGVFSSYVINSMAILDHHKAVAEKAIAKCVDEAKKPPAVEDIDQKRPNGQKCSILSIRINFCVWNEFIKSCPVHLQDNSDKCVRFRKKIESGDFTRYNVEQPEKDLDDED